MKLLGKIIGGIVVLAGIVGGIYTALGYYSTPRRDLSASIIAVPFEFPRLTIGDSAAPALSAYYVAHLHNTGSATATQIKAIFPGVAEWCMEISDGGAVCRYHPQTPPSASGMAAPISIPDLPTGESVQLRVWAKGAPITTPGSGLRITHFDGEASLEFLTAKEETKYGSLFFVSILIPVVATLVLAVYSAVAQKRINAALVSQFNRLREEGIKVEHQIMQQIAESKAARYGQRPWTDPETGNTYITGKPERDDNK